MKLISYDLNELSIKTYVSLSPQLIFSGNNALAWSLLVHMHLSLCQKHMLRVDNAENNLVVALAQSWVL